MPFRLAASLPPSSSRFCSPNLVFFRFAFVCALQIHSVNRHLRRLDLCLLVHQEAVTVTTVRVIAYGESPSDVHVMRPGSGRSVVAGCGSAPFYRRGFEQNVILSVSAYASLS
jgi:hypothetical protein